MTLFPENVFWAPLAEMDVKCPAAGNEAAFSATGTGGWNMAHGISGALGENFDLLCELCVCGNEVVLQKSGCAHNICV